jgi:hypothetical protein
MGHPWMQRRQRQQKGHGAEPFEKGVPGAQPLAGCYAAEQVSGLADSHIPGVVKAVGCPVDHVSPQENQMADNYKLALSKSVTVAVGTDNQLMMLH